MLVLYEDNHLIAVMKPAGVLVQGDKTGDKCLMDEVKEYLKDKYKKPGNVFLGLLHRLDRPVSGVILFAKTSKGASRLSEQIREHKVSKTYHALVEGQPEKTKATLISWLKKDEGKNFVTVYDRETPDAQYAELDYEVIKTNGHNSILKVNLKTGRSHQIRSQLAHIGHPIVGDAKYGSKTPYKNGTIALCATSLTFQTATGDGIKTVGIEPSFFPVK
jgi:23S rRNA pseudouridine1911/1915/1917 synthase